MVRSIRLTGAVLILGAALVLLGGPLSSVARGQLFDVSATSTGGTSTTAVQTGGNSLISLVQNLSNNEGSFAPLQGQSFNSTITYAGIPNAIQVDQTVGAGSGRTINLRVPSVGVNQTFSTANGDLGTQVRDYLKRQGLADLTAFQAVVSRQSAAGVVDGNPLAVDMLLADAGYKQFAMHVSPFETNGARYNSDNGPSVSRFWVEGGFVHAGGFSGQYGQVTFGSEYRFNDTVSLALTTPLRYERLESANIFSGGGILALPITIMPAKGGPFFWQVTPAAHSALVGSADLVSGGIVYGGQVDNSFGVALGGITVTMANEAGYFHGADLGIAGYDFNTRLDQWQFKNGLQLQGNIGGFILDASASWTNFLHDTFVDGYLTPELGVGIKFGSHAGLRVGYIGNFGNGYNTNGGDVLLYLAS